MVKTYPTKANGSKKAKGRSCRPELCGGSRTASVEQVGRRVGRWIGRVWMSYLVELWGEASRAWPRLGNSTIHCTAAAGDSQMHLLM